MPTDYCTIMNHKNTIRYSILLSLILIFGLSEGRAQVNHNFDDGLQIGASVNYGGKYFESNGDPLNDIWARSPGYQFHMLYGFELSPLFSINTGATLFFNRYSLDILRNPVTDANGEPTGDLIESSMDGTVGTTYVGLPLNLIVRPLGNKSLYITAGPELSYKVAHSNGTITSVYVNESGEFVELLFEDDYDLPEQSNSTILFINAAIGYSFDSDLFPINIEIGAKQAATPFKSGDDFITSRLRSFSFTASYRF